MMGPFSEYLETMEQYLPPAHHKLVRGDLYLTVLDWYTSGIEPEEAATRIRSAVEGQSSR